MIHHFQLQVLKLINQKISEKIQKIAVYLNTGVFILEDKRLKIEETDDPLNLFNTTLEAYAWLEKLTSALKFRLEEVQDMTAHHLIEIGFAFLVTCYFTFAFLYSSRKSWQHEQLLKIVEKEIANEETFLLENSNKLEMMIKVKMYTQKLISTFTIVRKMEQTIGQPLS